MYAKMQSPPYTQTAPRWQLKSAAREQAQNHVLGAAIFREIRITSYNVCYTKLLRPYGAIGLCQFMPTNAVRFGVDGDRDGVVDLFTPADALHSIANYLAFHGWRPGLTEGRQEKVIYHYNHDTSYAKTIVVLSQRLRELGGRR